MERRVLIAIFLSFIVLYAYQALVVKPTSKKPAPIATSSAPAPTTQDAGLTKGPSTTAATSTAPRVVAATVVGDTTEREIRIETRDVIAVFTNRGARLKSWRLKKYFDQQKQPQELIEQTPTHPLPFTLDSTDESLNATLNDSLYFVSAVPSTVIEAPTDVRFEYRNEAGVRALKEFHLTPDSYIVGFRLDVAAGDRAVSPAIVWGPAVGDVAEVSRYTQKPEGLFLQSGKGKPDRVTPKDITKQPSYDGEFLFAGVDDNYFMTVALPKGAIRITFQAVPIPPPPPSKDAPRDLVSFSIDPRGTQQLQFFAGPKDFDVLSAIGPDVTRAINFGMFAVIVVPLLKSLKWVNTYVGNYGWAIIILTVIINIVIFPLRHKSVVSMRKMQEIQPEVKAIQDRYAKLKATDPAKQKMNQELMSLYKDRGVNPASGCVPILLTFPLIFAFYALLSTAIELRGAPFLGWIHDLSAHDPYYVTPVLMGVSQLWQQWMMPSAGVDPAQQKMMMFMPIMFTFMFLWAPAGLAIYWLVSNVWQIGQQYLTNYMIGPPTVRTVRPPAERRLKRVGGGKTEAADNKS
jgi:YidC/Oxa1 family membrane protein insertase